jgi:hypothetical protein
MRTKDSLLLDASHQLKVTTEDNPLLEFEKFLPLFSLLSTLGNQLKVKKMTPRWNVTWNVTLVNHLNVQV